MKTIRTAVACCLSVSALSAASALAEESGPRWKKLTLSDKFYCEGATFGDFDRDGQMDVVSGPFWYRGPDFQTRYEIYKPTGKHEGGTYKPDNEYSDNFFAFTHDFNGDGWTDYFVIGFPGAAARLYLNPAGKGQRHWEVHSVFDVVDNESPTFGDFNGDGKPEIIFHSSGKMAKLPEGKGGAMGIAEPDWSDPTKPWKFTRLSPRREYYQRFTHGFGWGDVNGDGKNDLLEARSWWENPGGPGEFKEHPYPFSGAGGSQMYVYDVDGDGLNDVVSSLAAHGWGLAWFKQVQKDGQISFERRIIMGPKGEPAEDGTRFSQLHAMELTDVNGDGLKDIITGKRYFAHGSKGDAEPLAAPVLYWFELKRGGDGSVKWVGHQIDDNSGVGTQVVAQDINGDKTPDIVVGNKKGTFVFISEKQ